MFGLKNILVCVVVCYVFLIADAVRGPDNSGPVTIYCMACICEASSNCDMKQYSVGGLRGPFLIDEPYWLESGTPTMPGETPNSPNAFVNCANDNGCSARTVQGYMTTYQRDCNNDGVIDCDDYAAIHRFGASDCDQDLPADFEGYANCKKQLKQLFKKQIGGKN